MDPQCLMQILSLKLQSPLHGYSLAVTAPPGLLCCLSSTRGSRSTAVADYVL